MQGAWGQQGIEDYAAANAWLDRWALERDDALSIAWPPWEGGGMAQGLEQTYRDRGIPTLISSGAAELVAVASARGSNARAGW